MLSSITKPGYQVTATTVPEEFRLDVLPKRFPNIFLVVEKTVFNYMEKFFSEYQKTSGYWDFIELSNGGFYMRLKTSDKIKLLIPDNYFSATMSADAASIIINLYAYSRLCMEFQTEFLADHFHSLRNYASYHIEGRQILEAIN